MTRTSAFGLALAALTLGSFGCRQGAMNAAPSEPRLTNPVRLDAWAGDSGFFTNDADLSRADRKYGGGFRLPLSEDWRWQLPDEGRWALSRMELGAPALQGDLLLTGSSRQAGLFVLDRNSGRVLRTVETSGPLQATPLALFGDVTVQVEVPVAGTDEVMTREETVQGHIGWIVADTFGQVQRLDTDFEPVWEAPYEAGGAVYRAPTLSGDTLLLSTARDQVAAIDLAKGTWKWSYKREVARTSMELAILGSPAPVVGDGVVLAGFSDGTLTGLDQATGKLRWEARVGAGQFPDIEAEPLLVDGVLVAAAFDGPLVGLDPNTRRVLWTVEDSGAVSSMDEGAGSVYTADAKGRVMSVVAETGEVEWVFEKKGKLFGPPRRAGGSVLVADVAGTLYALDRYEGTLQWVYKPQDVRLAGVAAPITVVDRQVVFPTTGGKLISLIAESGLTSDRSEEPGWRADRVIGW